jgi:hypothetical protein
MAESDEAVAKARAALGYLKDHGRPDLIGRIGGYFGDGPGDAWLTSEGRSDLADAFGREAEQGGWLDAHQYAEFWGYVHAYAEGQDLDAFAGFLGNVLAQWEAAEAAGTAADADTEAATGAEAIGATGAAHADPFDAQTAAAAVFDRVVHELTAPDEDGEAQPPLSEQEHARLWAEVWTEVHAAAADWHGGQEERISDAVVDAYLTRLAAEGEPADALLAEIEAFRTLLGAGTAR